MEEKMPMVKLPLLGMSGEGLDHILPKEVIPFADNSLAAVESVIITAECQPAALLCALGGKRSFME